MSSTTLESPIELASLGLFNFDLSSLTFEPNPEFFDTNTLLSLLGAFSLELATQVEGFTGSIEDVTGDVTIENGIVTSDLSTSEGPLLQGSFDVPTAFLFLADLADATDGTLSFSGGLVAGTLTTGETVLNLESFDFATSAGSLVSDLLLGLEGSFSFADGVFDIDASTPFGAITGAVGFARGALTLDLLTPAGAIAGAVDFADDAIVPFQIPIGTGLAAGEVNFNTGIVAIPILPGFDAEVPLEALSGDIVIDDGIATLNLATSFGTFPVSVEFGPIASAAVTDFLTDFSGSATVTDGVIDANLTTPFGPISTSVDLGALAEEAAAFASQVSGSLVVSAGSAVANLVTPLGEIVDQVIDFSGLDDLFTTPIAGLF